MSPARWQGLKLLLDSVMDLTARRRAVRLAGVTSPSLAGDLQGLLQEYDRHDSFLEAPAWGTTGLEPTRLLADGAVLNNRYEVNGFLGAGGMGEVYRVFDREMGHTEALKTLRPEWSSDPLLVSRLRREVKIARRVSHPNICRLHHVDHALLPDGSREIVFFTMELVDGLNLALIVRDKPMQIEDALKLTLQLIAGLSAAHQAGVIHRDLKSANIVVNTSGRAVITDFGLAREVTAGLDNTMTGFQGAGTPAYMAPEQVLEQPIGPAADIYALGVVMFEIVTGKLPFDGPPMSVALQKVQEDAPDVRKFAPNLTEPWAIAIRECLERDPAKRPATALEVERILLSGESRRSRVVSRRNLMVAVAASGVAIAIPVLSRRSRPLNPEAVKLYKLAVDSGESRTARGLENAVSHYEKAIALEPNYADAWTGIADAWAARASFSFVRPREGLEKARPAAVRATELAPQSGRAHGVLGYVMALDVRRWLQAESHFKKAVALARDDASIRRWYGSWLGKRGRSDEAIAHLKKGFDIDPRMFALRHQLAAEYFRARRFQDLYDEALKIKELRPTEGGSWNGMTRALEWLGRYDEALEACRNAELYGLKETALCNRGCVEAARGNLTVASRIEETVRSYWVSGKFETLLYVQLLARLNRLEPAFQALNTGFDRDDSSVISAATSPYLVRWRSAQLFRQFLTRLGLG